VPHSLKKTSSAANSGLALSVVMQYLELELISYWSVKIRYLIAPDGMQLVSQSSHERPFFDEALHYSQFIRATRLESARVMKDISWVA